MRLRAAAVPVRSRASLVADPRSLEIAPDRTLPILYPQGETWRRIDGWVVRAVAVGARFGFGDLLIASLAADAHAAVWSLDRDFDRMARLRFIATHTPG